MMRTFSIGCCWTAVALCACAAPGHAQSPAPAREDRSSQALQLTQQVARQLVVTAGTAELTLVEAPLQRFSNPVVGEFFAHLFIWTNQGRPAVAASIQKWYAPNDALHVEFQSLSEGPLTASFGGERIWHPASPGVAFQTVPGSGIPAGTALARLREMRGLARGFRAHIQAENRDAEVDEDLRLLAQPVYRYDSPHADVVDGAVFSFVRGTDPELLLLLEARRAGGQLAWQYALAPMNSFAFQVFHQERPVWQLPQAAPPWSNVRDPQQPYLLVFDFQDLFLTEDKSP